MPNPIIHWELMVSDPERTKAFYRRVFDWKFEDRTPEYALIDAGVPPGGGLLRRPANVPMSSFHAYFEVADLDRALVNAVEAGATVIVPRMAVPDVGWFAMFLDPDRIAIGVMQRDAGGAPADPIC